MPREQHQPLSTSYRAVDAAWPLSMTTLSAGGEPVTTFRSPSSDQPHAVPPLYAGFQQQGAGVSLHSATSPIASAASAPPTRAGDGPGSSSGSSDGDSHAPFTSLPPPDPYSPASLHASRNDRRAASVKFCPFGEASGNTLVLCRPVAGARSWPGVWMIGPDWPCLLTTYSLIIFPSIVFWVMVAAPLHPGVVVGGVVLFCACLVALSLTALSDPGYVPKNTPEQLWAQRQAAIEGGYADSLTLCQYCNVLRKQRTTHCFDCNACVLELDHHCPWSGKVSLGMW